MFLFEMISWTMIPSFEYYVFWLAVLALIASLQNLKFGGAEQLLRVGLLSQIVPIGISSILA
jgi:hypothetical protein